MFSLVLLLQLEDHGWDMGLLGLIQDHRLLKLVEVGVELTSFLLSLQHSLLLILLGLRLDDYSRNFFPM